MNTVSRKWGVFLEHDCSEQRRIWKVQEFICRGFFIIFLSSMVVLVCPASIQFSFLISSSRPPHPPFLEGEEKEAMRNKAY